MKKIYFSVFTICAALSLNAQQTIGFESIILTPESYNNGSDGSGGFIENGVEFSNVYNPAWGGYMESGFAISNTTDITTAGAGNQYSSFAGSGFNSANYAVCYSNGTISFSGQGVDLDSFQITNTTYAAISMRDGDSFGKQFGSVNGADGNPDGTNGEDFYKIWIFANDINGDKIDSVEFYLADYRFSNNNLDYIVDSWQTVDLSSIDAPIYSVTFQLESSDNGQWGMNTPAYFAIDDLMLNSIDPIANVDDIDTEICSGNSYTTSATAINGDILWTSSGDGTFDNDTIEDAVYTPGLLDIISGTVTLTMTVSGAPDSDSVVLNISLPSIANAGASTDSVNDVDSYTASATAFNGTILWTSSGTGTFVDATIEDAVYIPSLADISSGTVTLTMTVSSPSCPSVSDFVTLSIINTTGISENSFTNVSVYPNPMTNELTIKGETGLIELFDVAGKLVVTSVHTGNSVLNVSSLSTGSYTLKMTNEKGSLTQKVIK